jgi:hypothetical protein
MLLFLEFYLPPCRVGRFVHIEQARVEQLRDIQVPVPAPSQN